MGKTSVRVGLAACVVAGMMGAGVWRGGGDSAAGTSAPGFPAPAWQNLTERGVPF